MNHISKLTTKEKYDCLIGMIEGCMNNDSNIVTSELLLDSLLVDLKTKYPVFSPADSRVEFEKYITLKEDFGNIA